MRKPSVFGNAPGFKPMTMAPVFGEPLYEIVIQMDKQGLMKTKITKYPVTNPPTQLQVMGMLLDCIQGQYQGMIQAASLLIDPNGKGVQPGEAQAREREAKNNGGEEKENDHNSGRDSSGGIPGVD